MCESSVPLGGGDHPRGTTQGNRVLEGNRNWLSVGQCSLQCGLVRQRFDHTCAGNVLVRTRLVLSLIFLINAIDGRGFEQWLSPEKQLCYVS